MLLNRSSLASLVSSLLSLPRPLASSGFASSLRSSACGDPPLLRRGSPHGLARDSSEILSESFPQLRRGLTVLADRRLTVKTPFSLRMTVNSKMKFNDFLI